MNNQEKNNYVRTQITETLLEMMKTSPLEKISISELVANAEVGRASFYRNYTDKSEVLRQEAHRLMKVWGGKFNLEASDNSSETLISLLDFIKENAHFYLQLYHSGQDAILQETILAQFPIPEDSPNVLAYLFSSVGYMTYGWIHEWIKRGMQESGTELAKMFEASKNT